MYILIERRINGIEINTLVSKYKKTIVNYLESKGYYYSKKYDYYIADKTFGLDIGIDYKIKKIKVL